MDEVESKWSGGRDESDGFSGWRRNLLATKDFEFPADAHTVPFH